MLKELYDELLPKGRIIPAGSCGTVGIGGLTLGGGYGFFSRKYGLTCDSLLEATLVDGNGKIHTTRIGDNLMWALKGGGNGNFGVVTQFKFKTYKAPEGFTRHRFKAFNLDKDRTKKLLKAYFETSSKLPETCFAAFVLNYKTMVLLITNYGKETSELTKMVDRFKLLADHSDIGKKKDLANSLRNYYGVQSPIYFKNASAGYYQNYGTIKNCIDDILDIVFRKRGLIYQINTLGGNIDNTEFTSNSCYPHRKFNYLSELQAYLTKDSNDLLSSFNNIQELLYRNGIDKQYRNYPNIEFDNWEKAYYGENYTTLQKIKKQYDPNNIFDHIQTIKLPNSIH